MWDVAHRLDSESGEMDMTKRMKRLLDEIRLEIIVAVVFLIGVIWITPILVKHLFKVQALQIIGAPSSEQNRVTLFLLVCLSTLVCALCCCIRNIACRISWKVSWNLNRDRRAYYERFEPERNKRVLQKILFEEIKDGVPLQDEEELWETLSEMTIKGLKEAIKERREIVEEMKNENIVADIEVNI